jgi:putative flippase GtrA
VPAEARSARRYIEGAAVVATGLVAPCVVASTSLLDSPVSGVLLFAASLGSFALAYRWGLLRHRAFLVAWFVAAGALAVVSIVTGRWNGLTDEPYATPAFAGLWPNLYGSPLHLAYSQFGQGHLSLTSYYVYLPLLTFVQVPGLDYRWLALGAWLVTVAIVRRNGASVVLLAAPWVALLAANGFNDFVPIAVLSLAFVTLTGASSRVAEVVSLGLKQFANVIVVAYHLWHRHWRDAALAVAITVAFLAPFAYLDPGGVWCHAILASPLGCSEPGGYGPLSAAENHLNYLLWPTWLLAVLGPRYVASLRAPSAARVRSEAEIALARVRGRSAPPPSEGLVLLLAPYVQLRAWVRSIHPELWTAAKFLTVGATGVVVNLIVFTLAREMFGPGKWLELLASAIAFCVATAWNFAWNYAWTFRDLHTRSMLKHGIGFAAASVAALSANLVVLYFLADTLSPTVAQFLGILAGTGFGFTLNRGLNFSSFRGASTS